MNEDTNSRYRRHTKKGNGGASPESPMRRKRKQRGVGAAEIHAVARNIEAEVVRFRTGDRSIAFNVDPTRDTVWASKQQMSDLFGKDVNTIGEHIQNIFDEGELDRATTRKFRVVRQEGPREVVREIEHYDLDVILAVGHRVKSPKAVAFRKWAYGVLKSYITKGYALNERRLRNDPKAADDLATKLRAIRSEEKHRFAKVRDYFKEASSDYDSRSKECRAFYALLQDKFHFAASGLTACDLVLTRADYRTASMGLTTFSGELPTVDEAKVGKNYLGEDELHVLHIVSEQFLLHVESKAMRSKVMTMRELAGKFDQLLEVSGYEVFAGYGREYQRPKADRHASAQHAMFMMRQRRIAGRHVR